LVEHPLREVSAQWRSRRQVQRDDGGAVVPKTFPAEIDLRDVFKRKVCLSLRMDDHGDAAFLPDEVRRRENQEGKRYA
jgi:hypothetical protein